MFPNLESLELKYCSSNRLITQKYFPPGTLLKHIAILSGLKNLKNLKLIHSYCEAENEWNFTKVIAAVTEKAILCLKELSLQTIKIQIAISEKHVHYEKRSLIAEITKNLWKRTDTD